MKKHLYINGAWKEASEYTVLKSPYSGQPIAEIAVASGQDVREAIEAGAAALATMAQMPAHRRSAILYEVAATLQERLEEAAAIVAAEAGKPLAAAQAEVLRTVETYRFAAEEAKRIHGETLPLDAAPGGEHKVAYTVREPLGLIGAITPFNFPLNLVAHKVGPAIAAGNAIVLKPASQTPLSALFIAGLFERAGLPAGALNVVTGSGRTIGDLLVADERIKMITFTGSPAVGIGIRAKAGLKRVTLELGSNSALIIDEGVAVERIVPRCVTGAFSFQGQVCISLQRIYVHESSFDTFVEQFVAATERLKLGDPLDPATDVSALISANDTARVLDWIDEAKRNGARVVAGGRVEGRVLRPTVITDADAALKVSCQEVFGPVVVINAIRSVEEGIACVNDSRFGLQAGIYTNRLDTAMEAARKLHVGGVMINDIPTFRVDHMPYGGVKESGVGREGVKYAIEEMTELKLVVMNW